MKEKKKQKMELSETMRVPKNQKQKLRQIGEGNPRIGLTKILTTYENLTSNPEQILMKDCDVLMAHVRLYCSENHWNHIDNFPAAFRKFIKTGYFDFSIMSDKRYEKPIDEFEGESKDAKKPK